MSNICIWPVRPNSFIPVFSHPLAPLGPATQVISSCRPGLAEISGKGHSIDCDKDDMDMEGRLFKRLFGQMCCNHASTRSAVAAIFSLGEG